MIRAGVFGINIVIETDDPSVGSFLEYQTMERGYNFLKKRVDVHKVRGKIYNKKTTKDGHLFYQIGIGWAAYIVNVFGHYLSVEDVDGIKRAICQDSYRTYPFPELRDYQNSDILHLLKYKFGLYTVYTGYGKQITL